MHNTAIVTCDLKNKVVNIQFGPDERRCRNYAIAVKDIIDVEYSYKVSSTNQEYCEIYLHAHGLEHTNQFTYHSLDAGLELYRTLVEIMAS